jgi:hypothetical protein
MTPSDTLLEWLLGIAEGVAAYGDQLDNPSGDRLALAAREAIDRFWLEAGGRHPGGTRVYRDEMFSLLLTT